VTLETGVMMLKIHRKIYSDRKQAFQIVIIFQNIFVFTLFLVK